MSLPLRLSLLLGWGDLTESVDLSASIDKCRACFLYFCNAYRNFYTLDQSNRTVKSVNLHIYTMIKEFEPVVQGILTLVQEWEPRLAGLSHEVIAERRNSQHRTIKQIVGHMVDSASNNTHRMVHLQYQPSPLIFPDYANLGNNDRWIAIQHYNNENWPDLLQLWKYANLHVAHVIRHVNNEKLENVWITALHETVSLKAMILDYPRHLQLHMNEIEELIQQG